MKRNPVKSSLIKSAGYDAGLNRMELEFTDGSRYNVNKFSPRDYMLFINSASKGTYFNARIRNNRRFKIVGVAVK